MFQHFRPAAVIFLLLTLLTGVAYPALVTLVAQTVFHDQANGSLIRRGDQIVGSRLIGQSFDDARYFFSRPSATGPMPYNGAASSGSNLGPINPVWVDAVKQRAEHLKSLDRRSDAPIPVDLVTASGSGLDPHITPAAAEYQVARVARERGLDAKRLRELVAQHTEGRTLGLLGEPRVNVLELNLALDEASTTRP